MEPSHWRFVIGCHDYVVTKKKRKKEREKERKKERKKKRKKERKKERKSFSKKENGMYKKGYRIDNIVS